MPTEKAEGLKSSKAQIETRFYEWLLEPLDDADSAEFARILDVLYLRRKAESKSDFSGNDRYIERRRRK